MIKWKKKVCIFFTFLEKLVSRNWSALVFLPFDSIICSSTFYCYYRGNLSGQRLYQFYISTPYLENSSSSVRLDAECLWTSVFKSCHRSSILCLGNMSMLNHATLALAACLRLWSCWKLDLLFCSVFSYTHLPNNSDKLPCLCWRKSLMLPPTCFTVETVCSGH